jgi:hypothetical protein
MSSDGIRLDVYGDGTHVRIKAKEDILVLHGQNSTVDVMYSEFAAVHDEYIYDASGDTTTYNLTSESNIHLLNTGTSVITQLSGVINADSSTISIEDNNSYFSINGSSNTISAYENTILDITAGSYGSNYINDHLFSGSGKYKIVNNQATLIS